jgi:hypothetical protein
LACGARSSKKPLILSFVTGNECATQATAAPQAFILLAAGAAAAAAAPAAVLIPAAAGRRPAIKDQAS